MVDRILKTIDSLQDKVRDLEAVAGPLLKADEEDWDRLEAHLATDMSGQGRFWQAVLREVRQAMMSIKP